ncbi:hypothetical protein KII95_08685 [Leuconostoc gelidum subsp. aenigmaticum]|uniref:hypothetical protein n=1 Tax=Leuconostoc gelidum TaxID=1244 RepID=UPI001CC3B3A1|nr:hypothetical protein [Leuconostoc gelidum]MBZ6004083.1 hypothetical protein [Leuconostoc gelidum subsp. aenigmaticum]
MKLKNIVISVTVILTVIGGSLVYIGHNSDTDQKENHTTKKNDRSKSSSSSSTKEAASESQSENNILIPSGKDYAFHLGLGGGLNDKPISMTKIFNRKAVIDVVASAPNMNRGKLVNIVAAGDNWELEVSNNNTQYKIKVIHAQGNIGALVISTEGADTLHYAFTIPESLYVPYRQAEKEKADAVHDQLVGKKYRISPSLYDGENTDQAMNEQKAPQNLAHDGIQDITFITDSMVRVKRSGSYRPDRDVPYALNATTLSFDYQNIPYSLINGTVSFDSWTTNMDGHTVTWTITPMN